MYTNYERKLLKDLIDKGADFSKITKIIKKEDNKDISNIHDVVKIFIGNEILYITEYRDEYFNIRTRSISYLKLDYSQIIIKESENLFNYLFNLSMNSKTNYRDKEFYKEIRIAKGINNSNNYKISLIEKINNLRGFIYIKKIKIMNRLKQNNYRYIKVLSVLISILIIFVNTIYNLYYYDEFKIYFIENIKNNFKYTFIFVLFNIFIFMNINKYENVKEWYLFNIAMSILSITILLLIYSSILTNFKQILNENTITKIVKLTNFNELNKQLINNNYIDYNLTKDMENNLIEIYNYNPKNIKHFYNMIENTTYLTKSNMLSILKFNIDEIKYNISKQKEKSKIKAINKSDNDDKNDRINKLENKIDELENKIKRLENRIDIVKK